MTEGCNTLADLHPSTHRLLYGEGEPHSRFEMEERCSRNMLLVGIVDFVGL